MPPLVATIFTIIFWIGTICGWIAAWAFFKLLGRFLWKSQQARLPKTIE